MVGGIVDHGVLLSPGHGGIRTPVSIFDRILFVFLVLGTLVGVVVILYTLYNAVKYRDDGTEPDAEDGVDRPTLGELPTGSGKGRKLFLSFGISAVIVLSLIVWTYSTLLFIEQAPDRTETELEVDVIGHQWSWEFVYPNGESTSTLRVPRGRMVALNVTSADVMHNIGVPELRVKADAIPGQTTDAWFVAEETGQYTAHCYELCGRGHSAMTATVVVMEPDAYRDWYASLNESNGTTTARTGGEGA